MNTGFTNFNLNKDIIEGLAKQNITAPTPIQALTIPAFLEGKELVAESHTGSGKTLAFVVPLFQKIDASKREMQAIILAPTHELVMQIHNQIQLLAKNSGLPITCAPIMGEVNIDKQIKVLRDKPHIIVGSAGRVLDLMSKKKITAHTIQTVILDEADNLLDQNQANTIKKLLHQTQKSCQLCIFSASISEKTLATAKTFMTDATILKTAQQTVLNPNIEHMYIVTEKRDKFETLKRLITATHTQKALLFVSQNTDVTTIIEKLTHHQIPVAAISGKSSKEDRKTALTAFKTGKARVLISSDLSARGLDVPGITHIFHFDLPLTAHDYLHRAGRTARGLAHGTSICITTKKELGAIRIYEREFKIKITPIEVIKGQVKLLTNGQFLETPQVKENKKNKTEEKPKSRNKYPKGFNSDKPKASKQKTAEAPIKPGTFSDVLSLMQDAKFGKNHE